MHNHTKVHKFFLSKLFNFLKYKHENLSPASKPNAYTVSSESLKSFLKLTRPVVPSSRYPNTTASYSSQSTHSKQSTLVIFVTGTRENSNSTTKQFIHLHTKTTDVRLASSQSTYHAVVRYENALRYFPPLKHVLSNIEKQSCFSFEGS